MQWRVDATTQECMGLLSDQSGYYRPVVAEDKFDCCRARIVKTLIAAGVNHDIHKVRWRNLTDREVGAEVNNRLLLLTVTDTKMGARSIGS